MLRYGCLFLRLLFLFWVPTQAWAELTVIVNQQSGVAVMTRSEVANIFLGRHRLFFNGTPARPVDLSEEHPDHALFYRLLLGRDMAAVNAYRARLSFSGQASPPIQMGNPEEVLRWVATHRDAIGYIDSRYRDVRVRVVLELYN